MPQPKQGQAATRQYFYSSRWLPKSSAMLAESQQESGDSADGQETNHRQFFKKAAENGDQVLLVFAHSCECLIDLPDDLYMYLPYNSLGCCS